MKDTLSVIQTASQIGKIVSKVLMIVGIVTASLCLLGIISLAIGIGESFSLFGIKIHGIIENEAGMSAAEMYLSMITGVIMTCAAAVEAGFSNRYFKNELAAGTPFTFDGAKEMFRLGILIMSISLGATIVSGIVEGIMKAVLDTTYSSDLDIGGSFTMGLMFFVMSFVCKHGAELSGKEEIKA